MPTEYFNHTEAVVIIYNIYTPYSVYTISRWGDFDCLNGRCKWAHLNKHKKCIVSLLRLLIPKRHGYPLVFVIIENGWDPVLITN